MHIRRTSLALWIAAAGLLAGCNLPLPTVAPEPEALETAVAGTLTAEAGEQEPPSETPQPPTETQSPSASPSATTAPSATLGPTATNTAPPEGVSLNCDGTYQRVRIVDQGASGKTVFVDNWVGNSWVNVWSLAGGDPMLKQILEEAGWYQFSGCQKLVIVPMRNSDPRVTIELTIHVWNGNGMSQVYTNTGWFGEWSKIGDIIRMREASKLGSINGSPLTACEWVTLEHTWNGNAFVQSGSLIEPVANCTVSVTAPP